MLKKEAALPARAISRRAQSTDAKISEPALSEHSDRASGFSISTRSQRKLALQGTVVGNQINSNLNVTSAANDINQRHENYHQPAKRNVKKLLKLE